MGLVWSLTYLKTGSPRWAIAGHLVTNLLSLSVPEFLGLNVPPAFPGG
jgi:membrane protease YdiL (CAAX protease family)